MNQEVGLRVNGEYREFVGGIPATLANLIDSLHLDSGKLVAEVNGELVKRDDFASRALSNGDQIELVRFVGGG